MAWENYEQKEVCIFFSFSSLYWGRLEIYIQGACHIHINYCESLEMFEPKFSQPLLHSSAQRDNESTQNVLVSVGHKCQYSQLLINEILVSEDVWQVFEHRCQ